ncbi:hypothetical protein [Priestia megaterium]|uniref:hypothetical protein n=1 Tax=Priestia megaterium TaxID=1404 RepID=UPI000BEC50C2|nr:hypothetical protein [Priestia megaterium]PED64033.1 hypothetical protein CON20_24020 [Priestia megaterium]
MKSLMGKKETYFADTLSQAESLVEQMKHEHGSNLKDHAIGKRRKKDVEYFIVTIVVEYYKVADLVITD